MLAYRVTSVIAIQVSLWKLVCRVRPCQHPPRGPTLLRARRAVYETGRASSAPGVPHTRRAGPTQHPGQPVEPASPLPAASSSTHPPVPHHRLRPRGSATHCLWQGFHTVAVVGGGALDAVGLGAGTLNARALMCGSAKCGSSKCGRLKCGSARSGGATCPSNEHSVLPGRTEEAAGAEIDV